MLIDRAAASQKKRACQAVSMGTKSGPWYTKVHREWLLNDVVGDGLVARRPKESASILEDEGDIFEPVDDDRWT